MEIHGIDRATFVIRFQNCPRSVRRQLLFQSSFLTSLGRLLHNVGVGCQVLPLEHEVEVDQLQQQEQRQDIENDKEDPHAANDAESASAEPGIGPGAGEAHPDVAIYEQADLDGYVYHLHGEYEKHRPEEMIVVVFPNAGVEPCEYACKERENERNTTTDLETAASVTL
jgi:hypothetical protein